MHSVLQETISDEVATTSTVKNVKYQPNFDSKGSRDSTNYVNSENMATGSTVLLDRSLQSTKDRFLHNEMKSNALESKKVQADDTGKSGTPIKQSITTAAKEIQMKNLLDSKQSDPTHLYFALFEKNLAKEAHQQLQTILVNSISIPPKIDSRLESFPTFEEIKRQNTILKVEQNTDDKARIVTDTLMRLDISVNVTINYNTGYSKSKYEKEKTKKYDTADTVELNDLYILHVDELEVPRRLSYIAKELESLTDEFCEMQATIDRLFQGNPNYGLQLL